MVQSVCLTGRGFDSLCSHHPKELIQKQLQKCDCFFYCPSETASFKASDSIYTCNQLIILNLSGRYI